MIHFDDRRDALGRAEPEHRHVRLRRHRIAVERDDAEDVAGQSEAADLGRARIEHVEQHAFALLHADRFAVTEHPAIDAEQLVADFEALGFLLRFLVGRLSHLLQRLERSAGQHVHRHVAAAAERRRKLLHHQKDFAIIGAGVVLRFDVDRSRPGRCKCRG